MVAECEMKDARRRGSALLIVLGMFSFMLVSAVTFSIYMRASRAPSSYVRRNAAARQLVKAALARAIDEIDTAIGNDPFPGVGYNHKNIDGSEDKGEDDYRRRKDRYKDGERVLGDTWHGRVFTPLGEVSYADTVSTLTLEAIGYLPASLVNEARYWSRHTRTAQWHSFNYGLGQYAFTAVNVSDFFDLGALAGKDNGQRRTYLNRSSSPHGRVSPTYLFRKNFNDKMDVGKDYAKDFLDRLATIPNPSDIPPVSLMDFNLAYNNDPWTITFPFFDDDSHCGAGSMIGGEYAHSQLFMAGGWNGDTNQNNTACKAAGIINLRDPEAQPFAKYNISVERGMTLRQCYDVDDSYFWNNGTGVGIKMMPTLSVALLCDYLDVDNIPLSLCMPCTEAVPMLCGLKLDDAPVKYSVNVSDPETVSAATAEAKEVVKREFTLHVEVPGITVKATTAYPFKAEQTKDYEVQVLARMFLVADTGDVRWDGANGLRTGSASFNLGKNFIWPKDSASGKLADDFFRQACNKQSIRRSNGAATESEAYLGSTRDVRITDWEPIDVTAIAYYEKGEDGKMTLLPDRWELKDNKDFKLFDDKWGEVSFFNAIKSGSVTFKFRPSLAIWTRVSTDDGDTTVDLAPAIVDYDTLIKAGIDNSDVPQFRKSTGQDQGAPLLRFFADDADAATAVMLTTEYFENNKGVERTPDWKWKVCVANDPRINWAPEHWWFSADGEPEDLWYDNVKKFRGEHYWCDSDIFMAVSDQGYLQSMYEWLMIPQTRCIGKEGSTTADWGEFQASPEVAYNGRVRENVNAVAHSELMWRTYRSEAFFPPKRTNRGDAGAYSIDGSNPNNWGTIEDLPFVEPENGLRVNPYTDITNIMLGAFANMPADWWSAGTNNVASTEKDYMRAGSESFKNDYLFTWSYDKFSTDSPLYNMVAYWMCAFRGVGLSGDRNHEYLFGAYGWKDVFDDSENIFDWTTGEFVYKPSDVDTDKLRGLMDAGGEIGTSVDRKFLYGYLKGCFANTAQLFLVFVRAESAAGGGGAGSGARAVALVWRDPRAPMDSSGQYKKSDGGAETPTYGKDNGKWYLNAKSDVDDEMWRLNGRDYPPHRTRILFYHQLD